MQEIGNLYLIPNLLGESEVSEVLPPRVREVVLHCKHFIVENAKNARHFIKQIAPEHPQGELELFVLNKYTLEEDKQQFLSPCLSGYPMGIISGCGLSCHSRPRQRHCALGTPQGHTCGAFGRAILSAAIPYGQRYEWAVFCLQWLSAYR